MITATMLGTLIPLVFSPHLGINVPKAGDWPDWRGPSANGMAEGSAPPIWSAEDVKWKLPIPGRGYSTPITIGTKLFLTTAIQLEEDPEAPEDTGGEGGRGRRRRPGGVLVEHAFDVICLNKDTGEELWHETAVQATPHEGYHRSYGSFASSSPVTDGELLFVFFGSRGIYCYDLDGKLQWEKDLDVEMIMRRAFGEGVTPVVHGKTLVLNFDQEEHSFIVALNKSTGEELWRRDRDEPSTWAPPLITDVADHTEVIVSGMNKVRSYDLKSGDIIWECSGLGTNPIPTPLRYEDTVIVQSGHRDTNVMAIALGKTGDLTGTDAVLWSSTKGTAYTPSPVLRGNELYNVTDRGFISCFDVRTGKANYLEERLPRGLLFKASPIGIGSELHALAESGEMVVIEMGATLEVKATIPSLEDEMFIATPIFVDGKLYLRSAKHLFCIEPGSGAAKH